jgi:hypothetical protein
MKNNTEKLTETKLTISLRTGLMHSNKQEEAHTQSDYTSYYIGAINYFIRIALEAESLLEQQTDSIAFRNDAQFREHMQFLVQISEGLSEWLPDYSHAMHNEVFGMNEAETADNKPAGDTAKQVSDLLNNPDLPEPIRDGLRGGLLELYNSHIDQSEFDDYEKSPEYVEKILRGYAARHPDE